MKYIICDLDGTLCDCSDRRKFLEDTPPDWKNFNYGIPYDKCNQWCKEIIRLFHAFGKYKIILVSGRSEDFRKETIDWLSDNYIKWDELHMRKSKDNRKDSIIKKEIWEKLREVYGFPLFSIDDRQQVVDMWREDGVTCLQCNYGNF